MPLLYNFLNKLFIAVKVSSMCEWSYTIFFLHPESFASVVQYFSYENKNGWRRPLGCEYVLLDC